MVMPFCKVTATALPLQEPCQFRTYWAFSKKPVLSLSRLLLTVTKIRQFYFFDNDLSDG